MSTTPFGRSRRAYRIDDTSSRVFTDAERKKLELIALGRFQFPKDAAVEHHHPCQRGIEGRPYRKQEKAAHDRAVRLLAASQFRYDQETALSLALCRPELPCRSALCWLCKHRYARCRQRQAWADFQAIPQDQLCHVTVLARAVYGGVHEIEEAIATIKKMVRDAIRRAAKDKPAFLKIQWIGYFEIDFYRSSDIDLRSRKGKTLAEVEGFDADSCQPLQLVHFHLLVALNGVKGEELKRFQKQLFPGSWRVEVKPLDPKKSKEANVQRLAAYMSKCHPVYQEATLPSDKAPRGRGRYDRPFDDADLLYHARLHEHHGGLGGTFKFDLGLGRNDGLSTPTHDDRRRR
ncbi:hypothetical protein M2352_000568 [Azospirillum fermentarium]|uniref:hypothetical protein n=1 Tax=Azospirillum fermentarium TaxID=1233114 RepID=UPI0022272F55|nr:hypothetical protein [Azospirillum fermentarium]MCW2244977.1 hypothetical protein [Azospirillum fermentarium]